MFLPSILLHISKLVLEVMGLILATCISMELDLCGYINIYMYMRMCVCVCVSCIRCVHTGFHKKVKAVFFNVGFVWKVRSILGVSQADIRWPLADGSPNRGKYLNLKGESPFYLAL